MTDPSLRDDVHRRITVLFLALSLIVGSFGGRLDAHEPLPSDSIGRAAPVAQDNVATTPPLSQTPPDPVLDSGGLEPSAPADEQTQDPDSSAVSSPVLVVDLGLASLRADPNSYAGAVVRWRVQNLGVEYADSLRSDMPIGEPYLLVRDPGGEPGLVYLLVPRRLLSQAIGLAPLQRFEAVARVRTGRSPLTDHPILEILEIHQ